MFDYSFFFCFNFWISHVYIFIVQMKKVHHFQNLPLMERINQRDWILNERKLNELINIHRKTRIDNWRTDYWILLLIIYFILLFFFVLFKYQYFAMLIWFIPVDMVKVGEVLPYLLVQVLSMCKCWLVIYVYVWIHIYKYINKNSQIEFLRVFNKSD